MEEKIEIRDITPPGAFFGDPSEVPSVWWWVIVILGGIYVLMVSVTLLTVWWVHLRQAGRSARHRALRDLVALDRQWNRLRPNQWAAGLAAVVRGYTHEVAADPSPFETSDETRSRLGGPRGEGWKGRLSRFLTECDQWRYAGAEPDEESRQRLVRDAVKLVKEGP